MVKINIEYANKILAILLLTSIVTIIVSVTLYMTIRSQDELIDKYKVYYNSSEKLFDEIETDNEGYFDGDNGFNYLKARKSIKEIEK